ncbi:SET domain-containing protein [Lophiostoma macrostomum CBS 122681]|uniref:SET domain-containing protein n=1 Tax=Lophiostoma macrostomum CBS 122681 TaxID=1314788 RepID=A0A6A6TB90_9PLEO|nr:SET domain-containing protein [Lophiostoma macrostomum CBS 122681]
MLYSIFCFLAFVSTCAGAILTLADQCWHEFPLSAASFQSSLNGAYQITSIANSEVFQNEGLGRIKNTLGNTKYGRWTHQPICTEILEGVGDKLCVYTNSSFSHGRGISIFTTPTIAEEVAGLPAFQDPAALPKANVNIDSRVWEAKSIPGKGIGVVAKRTLKFKDRVTAYTPALLAYLDDGLELLEREKYLRIAVEQLPEATRDSYLHLAYIYGYPDIRVQDIVKGNTFQLQLAGQNHLAIFPETSRFNHDCSPNAQYYLDPELLTHFVHTTRPVAPGEEINLVYTSPLEDTATRQQKLQDGFHFTCSCSRCTAHSTDPTLDQMQGMQDSLNDWSATSTGSPKLAEKLLQLYRKEGLEGFLDIPYGFAALAYNAVGNSKEAEKYANLAREAILMKDGPWTPNLQLWNELLKDSKKHWSYRRRLE